MTWSYAHQAGPVGALEDLDDYCEWARIPTEWSLRRRGSNPVPQHVHGEVASPRKFHPAANFILETAVRYTNPSGAVTHSDGKPGHVYENLGHLKRLLSGKQGQLVRLQRTVPDQGTVYLDCELLDDAVPSQARHIFRWPMLAPRPFWVGAAVTGETPPTVTNPGDAPIDDMVIDFTGSATDARLTHDDTGDYIQIDGALPAGGVRVDVAAGTAVGITDSLDYSGRLRVNTAWWMEFDPGDNDVTVTGGGSVSVDFLAKYR